ncbi:hypothetical protein DSM112329_02541 [Paraconexibacter sp. AEG42_29]|uniref:Blue (type 1) copper domain-containing protein n=1 Tax=Paraconexibacter sp. AEG42_29 TaxID=2997339 RepID=A0AAU7AVQ4_9ACTN
MLPSSRALSLLAVLASVVAVTGCGGDDEDSGGGGTTSLNRQESGLAPTKADGAVHVRMRLAQSGNFKYVPQTVTVKKGQKIVWTNPQGSTTHDVKGLDDDFRSDELKRGDTFTYTADKTGLIDYECTIHPGMLGTIIVQ